MVLTKIRPILLQYLLTEDFGRKCITHFNRVKF